MTHASPLGTALITGASSGIGATYADRLAKRGYDLILVARDAARLDALAVDLAARTGVKVDTLRADLTDSADRAAVEAQLRDAKAVTLFVNNAGAAVEGGITGGDADVFDRLIALNVTAAARLATVAATAFAARRAGAIVNISSVLALAPEIFNGVYSGTKAFLLAFSQALAGELEPLGVRVQAVLPGATRTEIWERSGMALDAMPAESVMGVDDLVDAALLGFDRGETVTIPPLEEIAAYDAMNSARLALAGGLSRDRPGSRYRVVKEA